MYLLCLCLLATLQEERGDLGRGTAKLARVLVPPEVEVLDAMSGPPLSLHGVAAPVAVTR